MTGVIVQATAARIPLHSEWFHTVVTSPPYYGLRSYEGMQVTHWPSIEYRPMPGPFHVLTLEWLGALGAEPTVEAYIGHMVGICREVMRVLRPDGVFWLNVGDSFSGSGGLCTVPSLNNRQKRMAHYSPRDRGADDQLEALNLIGVPYRLMFALQADGWIVRNDVVWAKNTTMPEPRKGWRFENPPCDCAKARREASIAEQMVRQGIDRSRVYDKAGDIPPDPQCPKCEGSGRIIGNTVLHKGSWRHTRSHETMLMLTRQPGYYSNHMAVAEGEARSNPRDVVWPSRSTYSGQHFAVFPPELIAPLLMATTPAQCCEACGDGYAPVLEDGLVIRLAQTCECDKHGSRPGRVLDPFFGSGTTGVVARELGLDFVGLDISRDYLDKQARPRALRQMPSGGLDDLPLFGGMK